MNHSNMSSGNLGTQFDLLKNDTNGDRLLASNVVTSSMMNIADLPDEQAMKVALEGLEMPDNICLDSLDDFDKKINYSDPFAKIPPSSEEPHNSINPAEISDLILSILDKTESEILSQLPMIVENTKNQEKPIIGIKDDEVEENRQENTQEESHPNITDQQPVENSAHEKHDQHQGHSEEESEKPQEIFPPKDGLEDAGQATVEQQLVVQDEKSILKGKRGDQSTSQSDKDQDKQIDNLCQDQLQQSELDQRELIQDNKQKLPGSPGQKQSDDSSVKTIGKTQVDNLESQLILQKEKEHKGQRKTPKIDVIIEQESKVEIRRQSNQRKRKSIVQDPEPEPEPDSESAEGSELGRRRSRRNITPSKPQLSSPETSKTKTPSEKANDSKSEQEESFDQSNASKSEEKSADKVSTKSFKSKHSKKSIEPPKISLQRRPSKRPHESDEEERIDKPPAKSAKKQPREKLIHKFTKINSSTTTTTSSNDRRSLPASLFGQSGLAKGNSETKRQRFCKSTLASFQGRVDEYKLSLVKPKVNKRASTK